MERIKIVIITNMMSYYRLDLFNELVKNKDYDFHIVFSAEKEANDRNWEIKKDQLKFEYTILKSRSIKKKSKGIKENRIINIPKEVFKTLGKIKPDIVIGSEYNPTIIKAIAYCKLRGIKYISWSDGTLNSERFISSAQKIIRKIVCRISNGFIASSTETREAQISYGAKPAKIDISLLTIDIDGFYDLLSKCTKTHNEKPVILFCGYLIKLKGVDLLLKALSLVKNEYRLDIIGSGGEEETLRVFSKELGVEDNINFLGYKSRDEIAIFYKNADIFVFPGLNDAFGLVLVEAIVSGLPVISSIYAGGAKDTVIEGENGFIVDPEDVESLTKKIDLLLSDKKLRGDMGKKSFELSKNFRLQNVSGGFFEAIKRCIKG